jgi:intracellular sulfur oxidation DsrE/DsrF family protein
MHPIFHVILAEDRLRIYTGSFLLEAYISTSNEPRLLSATDLNVCVCLEVLSRITMLKESFTQSLQVVPVISM